MKKIFLLVVLVSLCFSGCEKDDICAADTPTTPQLVIEFFDLTSTASKPVSKLKIQDSESSNVLGTLDAAKIKLPLKTNADVVKYSLTLNSDSTTATNLDQIEINYLRNNVFISRSCGYKTTYSLNTTIPILVSEASSLTQWIKKITITKPNILNEDETHVKIFF